MAPRAIDVVIVGGGPAGLSAALVLGRCRRDVKLFDNGRYRNAPARSLHGFLTRDRIPPRELRELAREEIRRYETVTFASDTIVDVRRIARGFAVIASSGEELHCGALLIATGFVDTLPAIAGAVELHGDLVVPCPYCDAWEVSDMPIATFSYPDDRGAHYAFLLAQWSRDVVMCSDKRPQLSDELRGRLADRGVRVEYRELRSVERDRDGLRLVFTEGASLWRRRLFYHLGGRPASNLLARLDTEVDDAGDVKVDRQQQTSIPGLFVAGDASRDVLQAIVAAGEGSAAAVSMNEYLTAKESHGEPHIPNL